MAAGYGQPLYQLKPEGEQWLLQEVAIPARAQNFDLKPIKVIATRARPHGANHKHTPVALSWAKTLLGKTATTHVAFAFQGDFCFCCARV